MLPTLLFYFHPQQELVQRTQALEEDWHIRQEDISHDEERQRRLAYSRGRKQRSALEAAEVRFGFLTSQARGWESEFERLQSFTGMDTPFRPGDDHIVEEITTRYEPSPAAFP